ncbi:hypothetical protein PSECIP111951_03451 [Pseudoalteromonas holothuriae]|uniref:Small-conductance mechanosensitive channel n=1 Tax=Pseudoalteromonas holothuriae TaxID=2963714 RepID=A0A9W4R4C2_9GAMM|nr:MULTISPECIES: mechanosensitive ion channel [unclassified Pseudoalteromonas]CAH9065848.1 hypothetical protein PSECIP111951_03451 [Pseudoalteromonas sp. CIP111951]CAH9066291.1 hypothetical protein PSECIP111854_03858 [Pseudoalteromonas sp. CIP111854]
MLKWEAILKNNYEQLAGYLVSYVPQVIGALLLLLIGWLIASLLSRLTLTVVVFLGKLINRLAIGLSLKSQLSIQPQLAALISRVIFWVVMVFFAAAALSSLGVDFIATWLRELLSYFPNLLAGVFIVFAGFVIGNISRSMAEATAQSTGLKHGARIGLITKWVIISIAIVVGIEQLGVNIQFIKTLIIVEVAVFSFGISLAFGLGNRDFVKNLVGSRQAIKHLNIGEYIKIGGYEGKILRFNQTILELETANGRILLPGKIYNDSPCEVIIGHDVSETLDKRTCS